MNAVCSFDYRREKYTVQYYDERVSDQSFVSEFRLISDLGSRIGVNNKTAFTHLLLCISAVLGFDEGSIKSAVDCNVKADLTLGWFLHHHSKQQLTSPRREGERERETEVRNDSVRFWEYFCSFLRIVGVFIHPSEKGCCVSSAYILNVG